MSERIIRDCRAMRLKAGILKGIVLVLVVLVIWVAIKRMFLIPSYLIPSPFEVASAFRQNWGLILLDTIYTGGEALVGFVFAVLASTASATWISRSQTSSSILMPLLIGLKAIPIIAMAPLLVLWFGNGFLSKAVMSAVVSFFPIVVNLTRGLSDVNRDHIELFRSMAATENQVFRYLRIPNSLPLFASGLKIASTLSVVGAVVGETVGANKGIGHLILVAALRIDTDLIFVGIFLASSLGIVLYYSLEWLERRFIFWRTTDES